MLYHAHWIYRNEGDRERIVPVSFKLEDVRMAVGSQGTKAPFDNRAPKTKVFFEDGRVMWLLVPIKQFHRVWSAYLNDEPCWDFQFTLN